MKKKVISLLCTTLLLFGLAGCTSSTENKKSDPEPVAVEEKAEPTEDAIKINVPADIKDTGKGTIELATPSGTSANGATPFIYVDKDTSIQQIGFNSTEFDGAKLSYIFIDGILNSKEQLGDTQSSLDLKEDILKVGIHKVEVTQYDNDKMDGKVITYKLCSYEVKAE